ncbi:MAG TPA: class I SAM-dependent methyltransferase [Terriglobia bacterium]|nr:class I SAM-dependent methyltransferase [Terriglobia bacterium]
MSRVVDAHRQYLADSVRVDSLAKAIGEAVRPGDVVLDLGAGTGILGLMACRAGAQRVYSVELTSIIGLARQISRANGFADRQFFIKDLSTYTKLPEKVDVIVTDAAGRFGFEAGLLDFLTDARDRFLKPGGRTVPRGVELYGAPVECAEQFANIEFWDQPVAGFDFRPARAIAANTGYPLKFRSEQLLSDPALLTSIDLSTATAAPFRVEGWATARRAGQMHGVGGWFSARLSPHAVMTNSPLAADSINRRNVFFPVDRPVALTPGDRVRIAMHIVPAELMITWKVEVWDGAHGVPASDPKLRKAAFQHSTFKGMLIAEEDIQRTQPNFVPKLTPRGEARLSVLNLCDGQRSLGDIEQELLRQHPNLFRSLGEAAAFVAEVVTRYSL